MSIDPNWYYEWQRRQMAKNRQAAPPDACEDEIAGVHEPIIKWCISQYPQVPYIHSRPDKRSTIGLGVPDLTLFYRGHAILIEGKSKTGKLSPDQLAWKVLAGLQGFEVHVIRSYDGFLSLIDTICQPVLRGTPDAQST